MSTLSELTARDLMQTEVIALQADAPIAEAVQTFEEYHIKGAPVLDGAGNLVGVITASDVVQTGHMRGDRLESRRGGYYVAEPADESVLDQGLEPEPEQEEFSSELLGGDTVGDWMTARVISVAPEATCRDVCKTMSDEQIHRVLVVQKSKIVGIISSLDVVRCVAEHLKR